MKLHEILEILMLNDNDERWFRPVSWKNRIGSAFVLRRGRTYQVPGDTCELRVMTTDAKSLADDWEITDAETVLNESRNY